MDTENIKWPYHNHRKLVFDRVKKFNPESILEAGCCWGGNLVWMVEEYPNVKLWGCDTVEDFIKKAKGLFPQIKFEVADIRNMPYPDKSMDVTIADMVLYFFDANSLEEAISELKRVTKKAIIISDMDKDKFKRYIPQDTDFERVNWAAGIPEANDDWRFVFTLPV